MTKVLTTKVHGGWEYEFSKIGYQIMRLSHEPDMSLEWKYKNQLRPAPANVTMDYVENFEKYIDEYDIIVVNRAAELDRFKNVDKPKIFVPHTINNAEAFTEKYHDKYHVVNTVKFTEYIIGLKHSLIYSSVSIENYKPLYEVEKTLPMVASMCANIRNRPGFAGLDLWREVTNGLEKAFFGGGNRGYVPEPFHVQQPLFEYIEELRQFRVFFNPTQESIMPMALYDAMALGMPIVTTATCGIPEIIKHGYNGYISNNPKELRHYIDLLMKDDDECMRIGRNARKSCEEFFNSDRMANDWKQLIDSMVGRK